MSAKTETILHESNSHATTKYRNLIHSALLCVFLSWLVRDALSRLLNLLHKSAYVKILAMVCHFYPGLVWNRLGYKGTLVPNLPFRERATGLSEI